MATEIRVPTLGESVTEATVGQWFKKPGDAVAVDETLCELETDKVSIEVPAPVAGAMGVISVNEGDTVEVGAILGLVNDVENASSTGTTQPASEPASLQPALNNVGPTMSPSPSASKILTERSIDPASVIGSGVRSQVLKEDALSAVSGPTQIPATSLAPRAEPSNQMRVPAAPNDAIREERVRMTRLRQTIARRLKDAQNTAAMLTTFNDVDMSAVMQIRTDYKDLFERRHKVKLGFMGFFVKACIQALREIPAVNAEIDGQDLIYKNYYHIGVAVGTDKGLVVPVVREAERMSLAEIETSISDFGKRAREGKLGIEEMQGGTFTITNGGVFGSMMSTPILNAPQSGILGMHRIEKRPVVLKDGSIEARPMMYLALSYDHRIVDGKEAVTFLVRVKEYLEDPQRFLLEL
ncbi:MAG TPA: Dihydrolipoyllysine-residue succinyltransferase component of 2-oxoglutarate dehydrogenase complex [Hyphomicrobiaceae bacterium MAG_BT-2024]